MRQSISGVAPTTTFLPVAEAAARRAGVALWNRHGAGLRSGNSRLGRGVGRGCGGGDKASEGQGDNKAADNGLHSGTPFGTAQPGLTGEFLWTRQMDRM